MTSSLDTPEARSAVVLSRTLAPAHARRRAFTMVELMVVIIVIIILATITLGLANRVTEGGKQTQTQNTIRALDQVLTEYKASLGARPPASVTTKATMQNTLGDDDTIDPRSFLFPLVDGRVEGRSFPMVSGGGNAQSDQYDPKLDPAQPTVGLFLLLAAEQAGDVDAILKGFDAKVIARQDVWGHGWLVNNAGDPSGSIQHRRLRIPVVLDGFGAPIRFVHPSFDGGGGDFWKPTAMTARDALRVEVKSVSAEFSRSYRPFAENDPAYQSTWSGDADEGVCTGKNPYFYSAGNDGDPGTRADNVYTVQPTFPKDTIDLK